MTAIRLDKFGGMAPRVSNRLLPSQLAELARNGRLLSGELRGTRTPPLIHTFAETTRNVVLIRRLDGSTVWFGLQSPASDIVKGPLINDSLERWYWSGEAAGIQYNSADRIEEGLPPYDLGTPAPATPLTITVTGGDGLSETRAYTYVYVNEWGEESAPAPVAIESGFVNGTWELTDIASDGDFVGHVPPEFIRIYRTVTGQGTVSYFLVEEIPYYTTEYDDTSENVDVAQNPILASFSWHMPPETVSGLVVHPKGWMVAFNGRDLYFSVPFRPHAWPVEYITTVEDEIVGVSVYNNMIAVLTKGRPVFVAGTHPSVINPIKSESAEPCMAKTSIVATIAGVLYASPNGLVMFNEQGPNVVTGSILTSEEWDRYEPSDIKGAQMGMQYIAFYTESKGFRYAPGDPLATFVELDSPSGIENVVTDMHTGQVWLLRDNKVEQWEPTEGVPMYYRWLSKEFDFPRPVNLGAIMLKLEPESGVVPPLQILLYELYNQEFIEAVTPQVPISGSDTISAQDAVVVGSGYLIPYGLIGAQAATVVGTGGVYPIPEYVARSTGNQGITDSNVDLPDGYDHTTDLFLGFSGFLSSLSASITHDFENNITTPLVQTWSKKTTGLPVGTSNSYFGTYTGPGVYNGLTIYGQLNVAVFKLFSSGSSQMRSNLTSGFSNGPSYYKFTARLRNVYRGSDTARRVMGAVSSPTTTNDPTSIILPGVTVPNDNSLLFAIILSGAYRWQDAGATFTHRNQFNLWVGSKLVPAGPTGDIEMFPLDFTNTPMLCTKAVGFLLCLDIVTA